MQVAETSKAACAPPPKRSWHVATCLFFSALLIVPASAAHATPEQPLSMATATLTPEEASESKTSSATHPPQTIEGQTNPHPPLLPHANATAPLTHPIQSAPQKMAELKPPVFLPAPPSDPVSTSPTTVSSPPHETPPPKPEVKIATSPTVPTPPPLPAKIAEAPALLATIPLPKEPVAAPDGNKALTMEVQVLEQENQALRKKLGLGETDPLKDIKVDAVSQIHEDVLRGRIAELEKEISRMGMKNNKEDLPEKTKNPLPSSLKN